jgi:hypothetical protein
MARLERENYRLKVVVGTVCLLGLTAALTGAIRQPDAGAQHLTVSGLTLVDEQGRTRAELKVERGAAKLSLLDDNGEAFCNLFRNSQGGVMYLNGNSKAEPYGGQMIFHIQKTGPVLHLFGDEARVIGSAVGEVVFKKDEGVVTRTFDKP